MDLWDDRLPFEHGWKAGLRIYAGRLVLAAAFAVTAGVAVLSALAIGDVVWIAYQLYRGQR